MALTAQLAAYAKGLTSKASQAFFGYDATKSTGRRSQPSGTIRHEDYELLNSERKRLISSTRNLSRNFPLIAWALNKHLDSTSRFTFHSQTGIEELDDRLELLIANWSKKQNCDVSKRHSLQGLMRLWEANSFLDGDSLFVKIEGGFLQLIEGNRIGLPDSGDIPERYKNKLTQHGLILDKYNATTHFCVCNRIDRSLVFADIVEAENVIFDGYFPRSDATRGVSPLAAAINTCIDIAESTEAALVKAKMHAFLGLAIYSDAVDGTTGGFGESLSTGTEPEGEGEESEESQRYEFDFKPGAKLELEKGDKVDMLESSTPSIPFQEFLKENQRSALSVFGIPLSFWNNDTANFSRSKYDDIKYYEYIKTPQEKNRNVLMEITEWVLPMLVLRDENTRKMLSSNDLTVEAIKYDWRAAGRSWIDEQAEVQATIQRIGAGLSSRQRELKKRGESWRDVFEELTAEQSTINASGVPIVTGQPGQSVSTQTQPQPQEVTE